MYQYYLNYWIPGVEEGIWIIKAMNFDNAVKQAKEKLKKYSGKLKYEITGIYLKDKREE